MRKANIESNQSEDRVKRSKKKQKIDDSDPVDELSLSLHDFDTEEENPSPKIP